MAASSTFNDAPGTHCVSLSSADLAELSAIIAHGSKSFHAASLLLPESVRRSAFAIYAFCRFSDDLVDSRGADMATIERLHERLERIYAGNPMEAVADRAFAFAVARHAIPRSVPAALIDGYAWDIEARRYDSLDALNAYGARVAGTVGVMMTIVMGRRSETVLARAADLGLAMQLTNIARDVGEDARNGRLYLPLDWLAEEGIDADAFLGDPVFSPGIGRVTERLLAAAATLYRRAETAIASLPLSCRPAIRAAAGIYAEIGTQIAAAHYDTVSRRAVTSRLRKAQILASSLATPMIIRSCHHGPPEEATRFLIEASAQEIAPTPERARYLDHRLGSLVSLIETLERRDRDALAMRRPVHIQLDTGR